MNKSYILYINEYILNILFYWNKLIKKQNLSKKTNNFKKNKLKNYTRNYGKKKRNEYGKFVVKVVHASDIVK